MTNLSNGNTGNHCTLSSIYRLSKDEDTAAMGFERGRGQSEGVKAGTKHPGQTRKMRRGVRWVGISVSKHACLALVRSPGR